MYKCFLTAGTPTFYISFIFSIPFLLFSPFPSILYNFHAQYSIHQNDIMNLAKETAISPHTILTLFYYNGSNYHTMYYVPITYAPVIMILHYIYNIMC